MKYVLMIFFAVLVVVTISLTASYAIVYARDSWPFVLVFYIVYKLMKDALN